MRFNFYLATKNVNKVNEVRRIMSGNNIDVLPCPEGIDFPDENGVTFEENALLKAAHLRSLLPGAFVAGEDSGLEVEMLGGQPGVNSARFAGIHGDDRANIKKLLESLSSFRRMEDRKARFVTSVAFIGSGSPVFFRGEIEGFISLFPRGSGGFGYDPVFILPSSGKTFAEMTPEEKNLVSHRASAFRKLSLYLQKGGEKR